MEVERFSQIYHGARWASGTGVLSGSGSTVASCAAVARWIESCPCEKILDLGCGDLEWMARIPKITARSVAYHGVDVVETLVGHHRRVFPWFEGESASILDLDDERGADLIVMKDVLFHLSTPDAMAILRHVAAWRRWRWFAVTSHAGAVNGNRPHPKGPGMAGFNVEATGIDLGRRVAAIPRPDGGAVVVFDRLSGPE